MSRSAAQLNIRSDAAKARVAALVRQTGKTATQVVEEALQAYRPPPPARRPPAPEGLEWRGPILVGKATVAATGIGVILEAIDEARNRDPFDGNPT